MDFKFQLAVQKGNRWKYAGIYDNYTSASKSANHLINEIRKRGKYKFKHNFNNNALFRVYGYNSKTKEKELAIYILKIKDYDIPELAESLLNDDSYPSFGTLFAI